MGGGGGASEIRQTWGGACPKSLKTPGLDHRIFFFFFFFLKNVILFIFDYMSSVEDTRTTIKWHE